MYELTDFQKTIYGADASGIGQMMTLTGSVILPSTAYEFELQRAVNEVFRLNDMLRARFVEKDGTVYQEIKPFAEQRFDVLTFDSKEEMQAWAEEYATIPLKLDVRKVGKRSPKRHEGQKVEVTPAMLSLGAHIAAHQALTQIKRKKMGIKLTPACCEVKLVQLPGASGVIIKMHHVATDAWSMMLLANQFIRLLNGEEPQAYQFDEYVKNEREYRRTEAFKRDAEFFEEQYQRCPENTLVWAKDVTSLVSTRRTVPMGIDLTTAIEEYATAHNTSPFIVLLTAYSIYLGRKMGRNTFYVGTTCINRTGVREKNTVGLFANNTPLLMELDDNTSFADTVMWVRDANFACFRREKGFILGLGQEAVPYSVAISYQNAMLENGMAAEITEYHNKYFFHGMMIRIENNSLTGELRVHYDHNPQAVPEEDIDELVRVVHAILREGVADDTRAIGELGR